MGRQTGASGRTPRRLEPLPFGLALGHRLRRIRESHGWTADDIAANSRLFGLGLDRSTVTRIELGQRQVGAAELLTLARVYDASVSDLLPDEPCRLNAGLTATPKALRDALTTNRSDGWDAPAVLDAASTAIEEGLQKARQWSPDARSNAVRQVILNGDLQDEATKKAARRLDAEREDVAVAAIELWDRSLAAERDARVEQRGVIDNVRARQAQRGHVTRELLEELQPVVDQLQRARRWRVGRGR